MKYRLNKLPVKTTNNFHINDVEIDLELPKFKMNSEFEISDSKLKIKKELKEDIINSRIGFEISKYYSITIEVNDIVDDVVKIKYDFSKDDALYYKLNIIYKDNSKCDFIIDHNSIDNNSHFCHMIASINSNKNSIGNITYINRFNCNSTSFMAIENNVLNEGVITQNIIDLSGKNRVYNVFSDVLEKGRNNLNTIYIGKDNTLLDFNYFLVNSGIESNNYMNVEGALLDKAQKNFRGTIDFISGCHAAIGEEIENCVLLSDDCISRSLPQMLCGEEDVIGSHGVSSGKVSEDKLFYLMSRGYSKKEAERLIIMGSFSHILDNIPDIEIKDKLLEEIEKEI